MGLHVEGQGLTVAHGDVTMQQKPISVEIPGFTREPLDRTTQGNTAVKTGDVSVLRAYEDFKHTFPYDPTDYAAWVTAGTTNKLHVITLPNSLGTFSIWCKLLSVGNIANDGPGNRPTYDVTFHPTCLDGSNVETAPAFGS